MDMAKNALQSIIKSWGFIIISIIIQLFDYLSKAQLLEGDCLEYMDKIPR